jgi:hypothetical protein
MDPYDNSNQKSRILDSNLKEEDSKMKLEDEYNESNEVGALHVFDQYRN